MNDNFKWVTVHNKGELKKFYKSIIPKIRETARVLGYAVGVHGSLERDLDLIAVQWVEDASSVDSLVRALHEAACGLQMQIYHWENKPGGRIATCFPICFPTWNAPSLGHIDLSVIKW